MPFLISLVLPLLAVGVLVTVTALLWWSTLSRPWLFVALSTLICIGVHRACQVLVEISKFIFEIATGTGYFLVARKMPSAIELVQESLNRQTLVEVTLLLVLGYFALTALRQAITNI